METKHSGCCISNEMTTVFVFFATLRVRKGVVGCLVYYTHADLFIEIYFHQVFWVVVVVSWVWYIFCGCCFMLSSQRLGVSLVYVIPFACLVVVL